MTSYSVFYSLATPSYGNACAPRMSADPRLPPVRMLSDGRLEFPYDKQVEHHEAGMNIDTSKQPAAIEQHVNPQGPTALRQLLATLRMMRFFR